MVVMETALESAGALSIKVEIIDDIDESENERLDIGITDNVIDIKLESNDTENGDMSIENAPEPTVESNDTPTTSGAVCRVCRERFSNITEFRDHQRITHNLQERTCNLCGIVCGSVKKLHDHRLVSHRQGRFRCKICHSDFKEKSQRDEHLKTHQVQYNIFGVVFLLEPHENLSSHIIDPMKRGCCFVCNKFFASKDDLETHLSVSHEIRCPNCGRKLHREEDDGKHIEGKGTKDGCKFCRRRFWTWTNLRKLLRSLSRRKPEKSSHTKIRTTRSVSANLDVFSSDTSAIKMEIEESSEFNEEKRSPATIKTEIFEEDSNEVFPNQPAKDDGIKSDADQVWKNEVKDEPSIHLEISENCKVEEEFSCKRCEAKYATEIELEEHLSESTFCLPFNCKKCNKGFAVLEEFKHHVMTCKATERTLPRRIKKPMKPPKNNPKKRTMMHENLTCAWCSTTFTTEAALQKHFVKSSSCKPFKCIKCKTWFSDITECQQHIASHAKATNKCQLCGTSTSSDREFQRHLRIVHTLALPTYFSKRKVKPDTWPPQYMYHCYICSAKKRCAKEFGSHISWHTWAHQSNGRFSCADCNVVMDNLHVLVTHQCPVIFYIAQPAINDL